MNANANNITLERQFQILAFSKNAVMPMVLFTGILLIYLIATFGNMMITIVVPLDSRLHSSMYFFLCNLAIEDIVYITAILPKLMNIIITGETKICFIDCVTQIFVFLFCVSTEFMLLTAMAYDRYVAICIPLHYSLILNKRVCALMASASWIIGALDALPYSFLLSKLSFCSSREINHFFCDLKTVLKLSCSDGTVINVLIFVDCTLLGVFPFLFIITSYVFIISTILKIRTSAGRLKTFSSCSSHLTVVLLFFGTSLSLYMKPESEHSQEQDKLLSLLYVALVPMLNPLVYSLRNKQVLKALKIIFKL
ncbi:olfactory receptor 1G1-like [Rhinophrynus dorsalis]